VLILASSALTGRYAIFDTEDYDNRQYVYERDVWLTYSLPAYEGRGVRNYIVAEYSFHEEIYRLDSVRSHAVHGPGRNRLREWIQFQAAKEMTSAFKQESNSELSLQFKTQLYARYEAYYTLKFSWLCVLAGSFLS
jgi:hypothetical protein